MSYRPRERIEATQVTDEWFTGAQPNPLHPVGMTIDLVAKVVIMGDAVLIGPLTAAIGDWVITDPDGRRRFMRDARFKELYEEAI